MLDLPGSRKLLFLLFPWMTLLLIGELHARLLVGGTFEPFVISRSDHLPFAPPRNFDYELHQDPGAHDVIPPFDGEGFRERLEIDEVKIFLHDNNVDRRPRLARSGSTFRPARRFHPDTRES